MLWIFPSREVYHKHEEDAHRTSPSGWTVKAHGIQVVKLLYLGRKEFKVLKELRDKFVGRLLGERKGLGEAKTPLHSEISLFKSPLRDVVSPGRDNPASVYEATAMWNTRDSFFWAWRRVREYFNQMKEVHGLATS